jgi:hypothetical protein
MMRIPLRSAADATAAKAAWMLEIPVSNQMIAPPRPIRPS